MSEQTSASRVNTVTALAVGVGQAVIRPVRPSPVRSPNAGPSASVKSPPECPSCPVWSAESRRQLNRFGSVVISPDGIEFDGDEVAWSKVTEIRTRRLLGYLFTDAITKQVDRLPLWWFPGRTLVLSGLTHTALTGVALAADLQLDRGIFTVYLPAEVHSTGVFRSQQIRPGVPASLVLADPAVRDCVEATARAHGISVVPDPDDALEAAARARRGDPGRCRPGDGDGGRAGRLRRGRGRRHGPRDDVTARTVPRWNARSSSPIPLRHKRRRRGRPCHRRVRATRRRPRRRNVPTAR